MLSNLQKDDSLLAVTGLSTALQFLFKVVASVVHNHQTTRYMQTKAARRASGNDPLDVQTKEERREHDSQLVVGHGWTQTLKDLIGVSRSSRHPISSALLGALTSSQHEIAFRLARCLLWACAVFLHAYALHAAPLR